MIKESASEGEVQVVEQDIVERVFTLGDRTIDSIMTHRSEIAWIDKSMTNSQIREYIAANLFNKYPVADKTLNDIIGIVYLKDLFGKLDLLDFSLEKVIRPALIFHDNMDVYKALEELRKKNSQYALIYDEFGSFQGVVTLKDVLEALIGFIPDDGDDPEIVERSGNDGWFVDGQCSFYDFLDYFGMEDLYPKYEYNTVSGLVLDELEHIPQTGEKFEWNRLIVEIADMDGARIDKLIIRKN
jgi:putative hemolysin